MREIIGVIKGIDLLLNDAKGHQTYHSGCGKWRNRKQDKKIRRKLDKKCSEY